MADLVITVANVIPSVNVSYPIKYGDGIAASTITQGQGVFLDSTNSNKVTLAKANTTQLTAQATGIAVTSALTGQPVRYMKSGALSFGAILLAGHVYIVSGANAGGIAPVADLTTGWYSTIFGIAISTSVLAIFAGGPIISNVASA